MRVISAIVQYQLTPSKSLFMVQIKKLSTYSRVLKTRETSFGFENDTLQFDKKNCGLPG